MSIRKLFDKNIPQSIVSSTNMEDLGKSVESSGNILQRVVEKNRFIPQKNYADPSNFAKFGSAVKYYSDSFNRIANQYPYDGSLRERTEYLNNSTYLDLYIFDNVYPRTTGYATISPNGWGTQVATSNFGGTPDIIGKPSIIEYIQVVGGPHTASEGMIGKSLPNTFENSNFYDPDKNRESNLKCNFDEGVTIEFWMNKSTLMTGSTDIETISHLTNDTSGSVLVYVDTKNSTDDAKSRLKVLVTTPTQIASQETPLTNLEILDNRWHHYAISIQNSGSFVKIKTHYDGDLIEEADVSPFVGAAPLTEITGALKMNLGASREFSYNLGPANLDFPSDGWCKLSGSIDEFRYWKTARTSEEVGRYWFTQYGGGTNNDDANTDLGVYLKFNEGITGDISTDSIALDYSGRISNGSWVGYTQSARSTGSAIDLSLGKQREFRDPIIYPFHPEVVSRRTALEFSGSSHDLKNNSSFYYSLPTWIIEEDDESGQELLKLSQILSSYFDTLYLQVENYPKIKDIFYPGEEVKPFPFAHKLLDSAGMTTSEIFVDATILEQIANRNENKKFDHELTDIKNLIYKNIYNNLTYIYKSKGNMKSFRNLMRCYGIDTDLVKINLYGDNTTYRYRDNFEVGTTRKKYIDFNNPQRFNGTIYQHGIGLGSDSQSFISASGGSAWVASGSQEKYTSFTLEAEVVFPKKITHRHEDYFSTPFTTSSLFGFHTADETTPGDFTWPTEDAYVNVYALREEPESSNVRFAFETQLGIYTSSIFYDVYDNNKWNFAVRFYPEEHGSDLVTGSTPPHYFMELYGVNNDAGVTANEFTIREEIPFLGFDIPSSWLWKPKRVYAGALHTNFTGSIIHKTDIKLGSVRYWTSHLNDEVIKTHARDPENYGVLSPGKSTYLYQTSLTGVIVPEMETLALNWSFDTLTGSNLLGKFNVPDLSSGSVSKRTQYGWLGNVVGMRHPGRGNFFPKESSKVLDTKFIYTGKQTLPENIQSSDMVNIDENDNIFKLTTRPEEYFFSIEKSMYQNISEEILNVFASIVDFNTIVGDPVNRYRQEYKQLSKLRQLFFERVQNEPDLDRYIEFYKWIDNSLSNFLNQLIPASARFSDNMRTTVESHVLERNKYWTKFPTIDMKTPDLVSGLNAINELLYNWGTGHHPLSDNQDEKCFWWNERAERSGIISSGNPAVDSNRESYLNASLQVLNRSYSTPYKFSAKQQAVNVGGANFSHNKIVNYAKNTIPWVDSAAGSRGIYITSGNVEQNTCTDLDSTKKRKLNFGVYTDEAGMSNSVNPYDYRSGKGDRFVPFSIYSASHINSYSGDIASSLGCNVEITNNHNDSYGATIGVPLQGPFTEKFVGGLQSRHIDLNEHASDNKNNRPEAWQIKTATGVVKLARQPVSRPRAALYRDLVAKRPVNIRNIKQVNGAPTGFVSGTLHSKIGNYKKDYEIVQAAGGRTANNRAWTQKGPWSLLDAQDPTHLTSSAFVSGMYDEPRIQRGRTEHVMVSRFSAPGGPDTMGDSNGGPGLDRYAAEFSSNNDLNWRNNSVRDPLKKWMLTPHVNQFGYYSGVENLITGSTANAKNYNGTGSFYQINRNSRMRLVESGSSTITSYSYDNYYVQRPIPATDLRYSWITASVQTITAAGFGYWPKEFYVPSLTNAFQKPANFVSSSQLNLEVDFAGMNNYIYEPIPEIYTSAIKTVVRSATRGIVRDPVLIESALDAAEASNFNYQLSNEFRNRSIATINPAKVLNALNLHRNGPYQHPSWKQSRTGQHKISRYLRKRNFIGCTQDRYLTLKGPGNSSKTVVAENTYTTFYYEPAVQKVSAPLVWTVGIPSSPPSDAPAACDAPGSSGQKKPTQPVTLAASLINAYDFVNPDLRNCSMGIREITEQTQESIDLPFDPSPFNGSCLKEDTAYGAIASTYLNGELENNSSPVDAFVEAIYTAPTFPSPANKFSAENRERTNYNNNYYNSSRAARSRMGNKKFRNGDN